MGEGDVDGSYWCRCCWMLIYAHYNKKRVYESKKTLAEEGRE